MSRSELEALLAWIAHLDDAPIISDDDEESDDG